MKGLDKENKSKLCLHVVNTFFLVLRKNDEYKSLTDVMYLESSNINIQITNFLLTLFQKGLHSFSSLG